MHNSFVEGVKLSRNFGHQGAPLAGLETSSAYSDCVVSIDADLQDDVDAIVKFIDKYHEGYGIVYGVRDKRNTDTVFKRNTALFFYQLMRKLGVNLVPNRADFRLLGKRALNELSKYQEKNLFIRGLIPLLGFKQAKVYYNRKERFAGESKYPLKKMLSFALDGLTSFSVVPIKLVTLIGILMVILGAAKSWHDFTLLIIIGLFYLVTGRVKRMRANHYLFFLCLPSYPSSFGSCFAINLTELSFLMPWFTMIY